MLGRDVLFHAARAEDGRGEASALPQIVRAHFGMSVAEVGEAVHYRRLREGRLGELAPAVVAAAAAGDGVARMLVERLADEVVGMATVALRRLGLLPIPEERDPPPILSRAKDLTASLRGAERTSGEWMAAFLDSPELIELHRRMLPPPRRRSRRDLDVHLVVGLAKLDECANLDEALEVLTDAEKRALLGNERGLERLAALWRSRKDRAT
jgi:membrane glycosyltransferase